eukprot:scaffold789_cov125-Isochrysis_galbana.AAC.10
MAVKRPVKPSSVTRFPLGTRSVCSRLVDERVDVLLCAGSRGRELDDARLLLEVGARLAVAAAVVLTLLLCSGGRGRAGKHSVNGRGTKPRSVVVRVGARPSRAARCLGMGREAQRYRGRGVALGQPHTAQRHWRRTGACEAAWSTGGVASV